MTHVDIWKIPVGEWGCAPESCSLLSLEEQERADAYRFEEDRHRYICLHVALRHILGKLTRTPPAELRFERELCGRPYLVLQKEMPAIRFSISSRHQLGLIATSVGVDVGVDIEYLRIPDNYLAIAHDQFSAAEYATLRAAPLAERARFFCEFWTAREAVAKAMGCGISGLRACDVRGVQKIDVGEDYAGAFAVGEPDVFEPLIDANKH